MPPLHAGIAPVAVMTSVEYLETMGDKSPKAKSRDKKQKDAAKTQAKNDSAKRQASFAVVGKDKK